MNIMISPSHSETADRRQRQWFTAGMTLVLVGVGGTIAAPSLMTLVPVDPPQQPVPSDVQLQLTTARHDESSRISIATSIAAAVTLMGVYAVARSHPLWPRRRTNA